MAELEIRERDIGRAHPDDWLDVVERMAEARAGVAAIVGADVDAVALTHATTDGDEQRHPAPRLAHRWTGRDHRARACRSPRAADRTARPDGHRHRVRRCRGRWRRGADDRGVRCRDHRRHAPRLDLARAVDDRGCHAGRPDRRDRARPRRPCRHRRRPGRRRDPGPLRRPRRRPLRHPRPEMAARPRGDGRPRGRSGTCRRPRPGDRRFAGLRAPRPDGRGDVVVRCAPVRSAAASIARRSRLPARSAGCRCTSGSISSIARGTALAAAAATRLAAIPGVSRADPDARDGDPGDLPDRRLAGLGRARRARVAGIRDRPNDRRFRRPADQRRLLQLGGGARALCRSGRPSCRAHARDAPATARPDDPGRGMTGRRDPTALPPRRSWVEIRWRQFRHAPRPVVRAVAASLSVAIVLAIAYLAYDVALSRGAVLPGGDLRTLAVTVYVALVLIIGTVVTYIIVPQPTGSGSVTRRSAWSAALGFFAAVPIAYLVMVVTVQVIRPLLG